MSIFLDAFFRKFKSVRFWNWSSTLKWIMFKNGGPLLLFLTTKSFWPKKKEKPSKLKLTFLEITQTRILAPPQNFWPKAELLLPFWKIVTFSNQFLTQGPINNLGKMALIYYRTICKAIILRFTDFQKPIKWHGTLYSVWFQHKSWYYSLKTGSGEDPTSEEKKATYTRVILIVCLCDNRAEFCKF